MEVAQRNSLALVCHQARCNNQQASGSPSRRRAGVLARACCAVLGLAAVLFGGTMGAVAANWSVVPSPDNGVLNSVSCTSWSACTAVGFTGTSTEGPGSVLAERWNGARWSVQTLSAPLGGQSEFMNVSCGSRRFCVADGILAYGQSFTGRCASLVGMWNGSAWSIRKLRMCEAGGALSCTSRRFCVMLGPRTEEWTGSRWTRMPVPRHPLTAISCVSARSCVGIAGQSFVRWNGTIWSAIARLDTKVSSGFVGFGPPLSCSAANACTVIGTNSAGDNLFSLVERWNGSSWSIQPGASPTLNGFQAFLNGVACSSRKACTIVGSFGPPYGALAERWNGARWLAQPLANPASFPGVA